MSLTLEDGDIVASKGDYIWLFRLGLLASIITDILTLFQSPQHQQPRTQRPLLSQPYKLQMQLLYEFGNKGRREELITLRNTI